MNPTIKAWAGQVTTGIGVLVATPAVLAVISHQMTIEQAMPLLVAAVIGVIYPENKTLAASAQTVTADAEVLIPQLLTAYRTGLQHGAAAAAPVAPAAAPAA